MVEFFPRRPASALGAVPWGTILGRILMISLASIELSYDGVRIVGVLTIPADAHHAGLAPLRYRQSRFVPREGLDQESAGDLLALCVAFGRRLQTEGIGAWEGTDPLF